MGPSLAQEKKSYLSTVGLLMLAALLWLVQIGDYFNGTIDDVFITLRVVNNVASGHGFVYNVGEYVEGYSNWSWVVMLTGLSKLSGIQSSSMDMLWLAKVLAMFFSLLATVSIYRLASRLTDSPIASALSVLFVTCTSSFGYWSICGLETPLVLFLVTSSALQLYHIERSPSLFRQLLLGGTLALLAITRPEAVGYGVLILGSLLYFDKALSRRVVVIALSFLLPFALFLSWRYATYGMFVPNTFYAKVGGSGRFIFGIKYCLESVIACFAIFPLALPFLRVKEIEDTAKRVTVATMLVLLFFAFFFALYAGADWMPAYRFILPGVGVGIIACILACQTMWRREEQYLSPNAKRIILPLVIVIAATAMTFEGRLRTRAQFAYPTPHALSDFRGHALVDHEKVAHWLTAHKDSISTFAAGEAGLLGFLNPQMRLIDLNGLMDTTIARMKRNAGGIDPEYILARNPDCFVLFSESAKPEIVGAASSYSEILLSDATFQQRFEMRQTYGNFAIFMRRKTA
jgi:arabinofuranosyltransferase